MAIQATDFIFNSKSCLELGLIICTFNSTGGTQTISAGSTIDLQTIKFKDMWKQTGNDYKEVLSFKIQVCKSDESEINSFEQAAYNRWLVRKDGYKYIQFADPNYQHIFFNVQCTGISMISVGARDVGMELSFVADAPYGYSELCKAIYDMPSSALTTTFIDMSDEIGDTFPDIDIYLHENCNFQMSNSLTGTIFKINNCKLGETISIRNSTGQITSTLSSHNLYNDFNLQWFKFANTYNTRKNPLTITGRAKVTLTYRQIRKVGV